MSRDVLVLFNQALMSPNGAIRISFGDEEAARQFRRKLYKARDKIRDEKARAQGRRVMHGPVPTYDINGNPIGITDVFYPDVGRISTPYDCLQFRIIEGDVVIQRVAERVLEEPSANIPPIPEAYEMDRDEVRALPPWPLRSARNRLGWFVAEPARPRSGA